MKKTKKTSGEIIDKLNLGCETDIRKRYINLDKAKFKGVDIVWDVNNIPFQFKDNTFSEILMKHVLEHVDDVVKVMEEIWRISKPNALIKIEVPYFSGLNAVGDPTHKHFFAAKTFDFFEKGKLGSGNYFEESSKINFKINKIKIIYSNNKILKIFNPLLNVNQKFYERFLAYIFTAQNLKVELKAIK